jgi:hypothetical protein
MTKSKMANRYSPEVRATLENYVHRTEGLGAQVPITRICYYFYLGCHIGHLLCGHLPQI